MLRGPVYGGGAWHTKELVPKEHQGIHHPQLENTLTQDVLGHLHPHAAVEVHCINQMYVAYCSVDVSAGLV